jgi:hypothetical protein
MSLPALLLFLAAPQPGDLETFSDWTVGCDNGRACHAVGLVPEDWPEDALTMGVRRGPEPEAAPLVTFEVGDDSLPVALVADGARLPARLQPYEGVARVHPADTAGVIEALRKAARIEVLDSTGKRLGTVSLKGATAALLYMDDRQRRVGTVTALVRPGARPASAVPPPPPLPVVVAAPPARAPALKLSGVRLAALRRQARCIIEDVGGPDSAETSAMSPAHTLLLLSCGTGAYNMSFVPYVLTRRGKVVDARLAAFDVEKVGWGEEGHPVLVNAEWDSKRRLLTSFSKGRGLGDCGTAQDFAWDGARFRLVEQSEMGECRGSVDYITTWRAQVRR